MSQHTLSPLDFDDPGAGDIEVVKGVTIGDIRAWHDRIEALKSLSRINASVNAKFLDHIETLEAVLVRCQTVLGNMALENEGAIFNRWPINHEPLRNDARNLLPIISAALDKGT